MMVLIDYGNRHSRGLLCSIYFSNRSSSWWEQLFRKLPDESVFKWDKKVFMKYMGSNHCLIPIEFFKVGSQ